MSPFREKVNSSHVTSWRCDEFTCSLSMYEEFVI